MQVTANRGAVALTSSSVKAKWTNRSRGGRGQESKRTVWSDGREGLLTGRCSGRIEGTKEETTSCLASFI